MKESPENTLDHITTFAAVFILIAGIVIGMIGAIYNLQLVWNWNGSQFETYTGYCVGTDFVKYANNSSGYYITMDNGKVYHILIDFVNWGDYYYDDNFNPSEFEEQLDNPITITCIKSYNGYGIVLSPIDNLVTRVENKEYIFLDDSSIRSGIWDRGKSILIVMLIIIGVAAVIGVIILIFKLLDRKIEKEMDALEQQRKQRRQLKLERKRNLALEEGKVISHKGKKQKKNRKQRSRNR